MYMYQKFISFQYIKDVQADHLVLQVSSQVPLGCAAPVGNEEQICELKVSFVKTDMINRMRNLTE